MTIIDYRRTNTLRTNAKALPNYKECVQLVEKDKRVQCYNTMQDMMLDAFEWDKTLNKYKFQKCKITFI